MALREQWSEAPAFVLRPGGAKGPLEGIGNRGAEVVTGEHWRPGTCPVGSVLPVLLHHATTTTPALPGAGV